MRKSRFTTEQIVAILQEHAAGASTTDLMRRHSISRPTFYQWKKRFGDLQVNEAKRLRTLEDENARLKRLVAEQALNLQILRDVLGKDR
jgi:putative transposase